MYLLEKVPVFQLLKMGAEAGGHIENHELRWTQNTKTKKIDDWEINNIIQAKLKTAEIIYRVMSGHRGSIDPSQMAFCLFSLSSKLEKNSTAVAEVYFYYCYCYMFDLFKATQNSIKSKGMVGEFDIW